MNLIKMGRMKMGYSQTEFANELGITNDWLSKLENGKAYPSRKLALKISKAIDVDFKDIFLINNRTNNSEKER